MSEDDKKQISYPFNLSEKHYRFALACLKYGNRTTAYFKVYSPDNSNLTASNARKSASNLIKTNRDIRLFIRSRLKKYKLDADNVLKKLNLAANFDMSELFDENDDLLPASEWGELGTIIQDYTIDSWVDKSGQVHKKHTIKTMPRMAAIKEVASILKLYPDKDLDPVEIESMAVRAMIALLPPAQQERWKAAMVAEIVRLKAQKPQPMIDITPRGKGKKSKK